MKKTLASVLLLSNIAMGVELSAGQLINGSSITLTDTMNLNGASVTLLLNVEAFTDMIADTTEQARPVFVSMTDGTYTSGFAACEEATQSIVGSWGITAGNTYDNKYSMNGYNGYANLQSGNCDWTQVKAAAITLVDNMVYTEAVAAYYLTVLLNDGTYKTFAGSNTGLKLSDCGDITQINIDSTISQQAYAFDGVLSSTDAISLNETIITKAIPEPTTATLSLLALAGLAARRRRK